MENEPTSQDYQLAMEMLKRQRNSALDNLADAQGNLMKAEQIINQLSTQLNTANEELEKLRPAPLPPKPPKEIK